jgi:hypothetical protein
VDERTTLPIEAQRVAGSAAHLIHHLATCDVCQLAGTRWCSEIDELAAIVRADRGPLLGASFSAKG